MNEVLGALHIREFTVQAVMATGVAKRKAERIIKAARHAAHGIHCYLLRRPELLRYFEDAYKVESKLAYSHVALVPYSRYGRCQSILQLCVWLEITLRMARL
ncbi:hypothetical protein D3C77_450090 [compost metagenome]